MRPPLLALAALLLTTSAAAGPKKDPGALPEEIDGYAKHEGIVKQLMGRNGFLRLRNDLYFPTNTDEMLLSVSKLDGSGWDKHCLAGFRTKYEKVEGEDEGDNEGYILKAPKTHTDLPLKTQKDVEDFFAQHKRAYCTITLTGVVTDQGGQSFAAGEKFFVAKVATPSSKPKIIVTFQQSEEEAKEGEYASNHPRVAAITCQWPGAKTYSRMNVPTFLEELPLVRMDEGCAGELFDAWVVADPTKRSQ
jgi:hypothetical protein